MQKSKSVDSKEGFVDTLGGDLSPAEVAWADKGLLADLAAERIREMIASGQLGPGDRLNEVEIAAKLAISRGPVREAVRRFASAGLVVSERNLGSRLVEVDEKMVRALYEVRESLESLAARMAAQRMNADEKAQLIVTLNDHEHAIRNGASDAYPAGHSDWEFHLAILKGSGNEVAWRICGVELRDMFALLRARHGRVPGRGKAALKEHRYVAEAIAAGDVDLSGLLMAQHIRNSHRNQLALMGSEVVISQGEET